MDCLIPARRVIARNAEDRPLLMVIVDTEEEFDWSGGFSRANTAVTSIQNQLLAHEQVFDQYKIRPTYVVDYPVVATAESCAVLQELHDAGRCQIGAHLHPWVTPPYEETVNVYNSYPGNLSRPLEREKLQQLTDLIADKFSHRPIVYKAGRYGVGPNTAQLLEELDYRVDASVVPHTDFSADGGPDFKNYQDRPYCFGSNSELLEIPLSVGFAGGLHKMGCRLSTLLDHPIAKMVHARGICSRLNLLERIRLTPEGVTAKDQKRLLVAMYGQGHRVFSYTYHSSSLAAGHTPYVQSQQQLELFLETMAEVFEFFQNKLNGQFTTPADYHHQIATPPSSL